MQVISALNSKYKVQDNSSKNNYMGTLSNDSSVSHMALTYQPSPYSHIRRLDSGISFLESKARFGRFCRQS
jgi:hypothetical protein